MKAWSNLGLKKPQIAIEHSLKSLRAAVLTGALGLWRRPLAGNSSADMNVLRALDGIRQVALVLLSSLVAQKKPPVTLFVRSLRSLR